MIHSLLSWCGHVWLLCCATSHLCVPSRISSSCPLLVFSQRTIQCVGRTCIPCMGSLHLSVCAPRPCVGFTSAIPTCVLPMCSVLFEAHDRTVSCELHVGFRVQLASACLCDVCLLNILFPLALYVFCRM